MSEVGAYHSPNLFVEVSQNPRRGFGPSWPICCPTLLVAVRAGLAQRLVLGAAEHRAPVDVPVGNWEEISPPFIKQQ
jgi:hypothetical protein